MKKEVEKILGEIASRKLRVKTLKAQKHDAMDFHDVHVDEVREALSEAYEAGRKLSASAMILKDLREKELKEIKNDFKLLAETFSAVVRNAQYAIQEAEKGNLPTLLQLEVGNRSARAIAAKIEERTRLLNLLDLLKGE